MWQAEYTTTTDVPAEALFAAISDVGSWNKWDTELESTEIQGPARQGSNFLLKPKGGPNVKMSVDELIPFSRFVDTAHLPLAKMQTIHEFSQCEDGTTTIHIVLKVWGGLGFFWRKAVAEKQINGAPSQTAAFIAYAKSTQ